jgi:hypothetical protein
MRIVEYWAYTEHASIRAFALAPGMIPTRLAAETGAAGSAAAGTGGDEDAELRKVAPDSVALPAATMLYLTSGRADWLSGRFVPLIRSYFASFRLTSSTHTLFMISFLMGLAGIVLRTGIWPRWNGTGRT